MNGPVLLLTHSEDFYTIDLVAAALRRRGAVPMRVDTDTFPLELSLTTHLSPRGERFILSTREGRTDLQEVRAVWARRLWPGRLPPSMSPRFAHSCAQQARTAFLDSLLLLQQAFWLNPIREMLAAESKLLQLRMAREVGLLFPETLVSNDPGAVRGFYQSLQGRMATKLLVPLSQTMDGSGEFMYTSEVRPEELEGLDAIQYAPQIFQPLIEKERELRVIIVGRQLFVGAIDARGTIRGQVDWRRSAPGEGVCWTRAELPPSVEAQARALLARLGLVSGALDFIVDWEGRHYFLEVNPAGEWGFLQRDLGLPIAEAIAQTLLEGAGR